MFRETKKNEDLDFRLYRSVNMLQIKIHDSTIRKKKDWTNLKFVWKDFQE